MKTKTTLLLTAIVIIATSLIYTGCTKEDPQQPANTSAASDNATADNAFSGILKQVSIVSDSSNSLKSMSSALASCATATITPYDLTTWPKTVVINFGTNNCLGNDLVNRRGIITAVFSGPYADSGTVITITTSDFYHNDYKVDGTQTIKNKGHIVAGNVVFNVTVNNATITHPTGETSTWSTNQDREWNKGLTPTFIDDYYLIRGTASGISAKGETYSIVTNSDLRVSVTCPWIVSGKFTLTLATYPNYPIVFDYGTGSCDALATATLNGKSYNIIMR